MNKTTEENSSSINYSKLTSYLLGFISFVIFVYILIAFKRILVPVTLAIFLTFLFHPLIEYLQKFKFPKWLSLILILFFISGIYYLIGLLVVANFGTFTEKLQTYSENLAVFLQQILSPFNLTVKEVAQMFNIKTEQLDVSSLFQNLFKAGIIQNLFSSFSSMLGDFFILLIFWIFMIMGKKQFEERLKSAFNNRRHIIESSMNSINSQLQSYIIIKTITSLTISIIVTIILLLFGIDFAIFWGLLTFILNFIPNIGSIVATLFPIVISLLDYGIGVKTISLAALLIINQNIIGNFIEPHFMGKQMDLSPVFVLFSLIFWGWIWGIAGMFLSVPIAAAMKIFCSNIEPLKPISIIMGRKVAEINS
jgi:predicted PurR-regulated permease PerM